MVVDTSEVAIDEAREYRRREARSLKNESQSSLTCSLAGDVDCIRRPTGRTGEVGTGRTWVRKASCADGRATVDWDRTSSWDAICEPGRSEREVMSEFIAVEAIRPVNTERTDIVKGLEVNVIAVGSNQEIALLRGRRSIDGYVSSSAE